MLQNPFIQDLLEDFCHIPDGSSTVGGSTWSTQVFGQALKALHNLVSLQLKEESVAAEQGLLLNEPGSYLGTVAGYIPAKK